DSVRGESHVLEPVRRRKGCRGGCSEGQIRGFVITSPDPRSPGAGQEPGVTAHDVCNMALVFLSKGRSEFRRSMRRHAACNPPANSDPASFVAELRLDCRCHNVSTLSGGGGP